MHPPDKGQCIRRIKFELNYYHIMTIINDTVGPNIELTMFLLLTQRPRNAIEVSSQMVVTTFFIESRWLHSCPCAARLRRACDAFLARN